MFACSKWSTPARRSPGWASFAPYRLLECDPLSAPNRIGSKDGCYSLADILNDNAARALTFWNELMAPVRFSSGGENGHEHEFSRQLGDWLHAGIHRRRVGGKFRRPRDAPDLGVSGAGPILHEIFAQLHEKFGTSWYRNLPRLSNKRSIQSPANWSASTAAGAVKEKVLARALPETESPNDCDAEGESSSARNIASGWRARPLIR